MYPSGLGAVVCFNGLITLRISSSVHGALRMFCCDDDRDEKKILANQEVFMERMNKEGHDNRDE